MKKTPSTSAAAPAANTKRAASAPAAASASASPAPDRESFPIAVGPAEDSLERQIVAHHFREEET